jgi:Uma2 family endonuclease
VIEVRSPGDESYDKLPFFAKLGVREVLIIDRDTKRVDLFRLASGQYVRQEPDTAGEVVSEVLAVRFRTLPTMPARLLLCDTAGGDERVEI